MTRNFKLFLGATIIFYLIGAINNASAMYVLSAASLAVMLGAYVLSRAAVSGFRLSLTLPGDRAKAGATMPFTLHLENLRRATRPTPTVTLRAENLTVADVGRGYRFVLPSVAPQATVEADVAVECPARGRYEITEVSLEGIDPVGMFRRPRRFPVSLSFVAMPRIYSAPGIAAWELLSPVGRRLARTRRRDAGDFGGIREYAPGDDLRHVHWKATAHTARLAIKEFEQRQDAEVAIWLDLSAPGAVGEGVDSSTEIGVSLAASMLHAFVRADYSVQLIGDGLERSLALPSRGEAYLGRALLSLAEAQPQGKQPFSATVMEQVRWAGRAQAVFVITSGADPALGDALAFCSAHGLSPTVFVVAPGGRLPDGTDPVARMRGVGVTAVVVGSMGGIPDGLRESAAIGERQLAG